MQTLTIYVNYTKILRRIDLSQYRTVHLLGLPIAITAISAVMRHLSLLIQRQKFFVPGISRCSCPRQSRRREARICSSIHFCSFERTWSPRHDRDRHATLHVLANPKVTLDRLESRRPFALTFRKID